MTGLEIALTVCSLLMLIGSMGQMWVIWKLAAKLRESRNSNLELIGLIERANVRYHAAQAALQGLGFASINGNEDVN